MNEEKLYLLLKLVEKQQSLNGLIRAGLSFKEIGEFTQEIAEERLLTITSEGIVLTELGKKRYEILKILYKKTNKATWIEKEIQSQIPKISTDFIFLPDQNELFFE